MRYVLVRYVLAAIFVGAANMPAAFALPVAGANPVSVSMSKAEPIMQAAKRNKPPRAHPNHHSRKGDGGIHPLVGSGDY